jgi:hypothetical protein
MSLNFFNDLELTEAHLEVVTSCVNAWCSARHVSVDSAVARSAMALALDLLAGGSPMTSHEVVQILLSRLPANSDEYPRTFGDVSLT